MKEATEEQKLTQATAQRVLHLLLAALNTNVADNQEYFGVLILSKVDVERKDDKAVGASMEQVLVANTPEWMLNSVLESALAAIAHQNAEEGKKSEFH